MVKIAPSILSADFSRLGEQVKEASEAGADLIHVDVMDGHFVPNLTIGPDVVASIRAWTTVPLDTHLMVVHPQTVVERFARAGSDDITVHVESDHDVRATLRAVRNLGVSPGLVINPATPFEAARPFLQEADLLLVMTVNPGFGGQSMIREALAKVSEARRHREREGLRYEIEVDGGVKPENAADVVRAGADVLVAGSAIFPRDIAARIRRLRAAAEQGL